MGVPDGVRSWKYLLDSRAWEIGGAVSTRDLGLSDHLSSVIIADYGISSGCEEALQGIYTVFTVFTRYLHSITVFCTVNRKPSYPVSTSQQRRTSIRYSVNRHINHQSVIHPPPPPTRTTCHAMHGLYVLVRPDPRSSARSRPRTRLHPPSLAHAIPRGATPRNVKSPARPETADHRLPASHHRPLEGRARSVPPHR